MGIAIASIPILVFLGYKSCVTSTNTEKSVEVEENGFRQGVLVSLMNLMVYPFWLLWGQIFVRNGWLQTDISTLGVFSIGAGIGTLFAFLCFVYLGKLLWKRLNYLQFLINKLIAFVFWGFAVLLNHKMMKKRIIPLGICSILSTLSQAQIRPQKILDASFIQQCSADSSFLNKKMDTIFQKQVNLFLMRNRNSVVMPK